MQKRRKEKEAHRHIVARDTKATSTVSESRGIAPFGQLAREQQAARASDRRPHRTPLALARHEWDNESVRLHANNSDVTYLLQVLQCRCSIVPLVSKPFVSRRSLDWNVAHMMIPIPIWQVDSNW